MKISTMALVLGALLVAGPFAGPAGAAELDTLLGKLRKYAPTEAPYRNVCVCQDHGPLHGYAGYLASSTLGAGPGLVKVVSSCSVPTFDADGKNTGGGTCRPFAILAR